MAMVKISNGEVTQIVSRGAYESQYKKLGFNIVGGNKVSKVDNKPIVNNNVENVSASIVDDNANDLVDDFEEADDFEELLEKPLSQWSNEELKMFTNAKNIDTSSAKKTSEVRGLVKKYLDNEAKRNA